MAQTLISKRQIAGGLDGWIPAEETWTYASADDPTFTFTVAADVTTKYSAGMKIKLTQTTVKYFIITAVSAFTGGNTTITVYGGTDYDLANATITLPYYSMVKSPQGFPMSPAKWTYSPSMSTTTTTGYVSLGTISLPIGIWNTDISARMTAAGNNTARNGDFNIQVNLALSTANNSFAGNYKVSTLLNYFNTISTADTRLETAYGILFIQERLLDVSVKTTLYLVSRLAGTTVASGAVDNIVCNFICAYL